MVEIVLWGATALLVTGLLVTGLLVTGRIVFCGAREGGAVGAGRRDHGRPASSSARA